MPAEASASGSAAGSALRQRCHISHRVLHHLQPSTDSSKGFSQLATSRTPRTISPPRDIPEIISWTSPPSMLIAVDMLIAKSLTCFLLLHEVPAAGDVAVQLSISTMGPFRDVPVVLAFDHLPSPIAGLLPATAAQRTILGIVAGVASIRGHSD